MNPTAEVLRCPLARLRALFGIAKRAISKGQRGDCDRTEEQRPKEQVVPA
jgi:hypothetical protein